MKIIKYILLFLFFLVFKVQIVQSTIILTNHLPYPLITNELFSSSSEEKEWLGVLHLKEFSKFGFTSQQTGLSRENKKFFKNPELVNAWGIVKDGPGLLRRNPDNLEKLSKFMKETGMEESKLISSFGNAKNPQKWIDMKIPEADLDVVYDGFKNSPPAKLDAWTPEHKAQRWANHKAGNPDADFKTWSNQYDGNIDKVTAANKGIDDYISTYSGTVVREKSFSNISINTPDGVQSFTRRLDIVDEDVFKGIEFKEYSSGKVYRSPDVIREYTLDGKLLKDDLLDEIEWLFKGCEPSGPLRTDLEALGIKIILLP